MHHVLIHVKNHLNINSAYTRTIAYVNMARSLIENYCLNKMINDIVESVPSDNTTYDNLCQVCYAKEPSYICPDCKFKTCSNCLRVYLLEYSNLEPHCMNCESRLTFNTIYKTIKPEHFDKYFQ